MIYVSKRGGEQAGIGTSQRPFLNIVPAMAYANPLSSKSNPSIIHLSEGNFEQQLIYHEKGTIIFRGTSAIKVNITNAPDNIDV
ncbi:MAG: hypothetical protein EZS28_036897 [Streblomastix strix]|uniref:Uncharacterized protein n=1 Tax=Streblomastix strix TaxID=222440 RepID=A0A5J4U9K9_9EUKA|nr:MAG: hypothetical protein EZS28_036897 [Streblomastix strix]